VSLVERLRREPIGVALVLINIALASVILYRKASAPPSRMPPGHPDVSVPAGLAGAAPARDSFALNGVVKLGEGRKWPQGGAYVFVIARAEGGGGLPYAVRRYENASLPLAWSLDSENVMIAGMPKPEKLIVTARADQDGNPMTRQLGDLESAPVALTGTNAAVELTLDREAPLSAP